MPRYVTKVLNLDGISQVWEHKSVLHFFCDVQKRKGGGRQMMKENQYETQTLF